MAVQWRAYLFSQSIQGTLDNSVLIVGVGFYLFLYHPAVSSVAVKQIHLCNFIFHNLAAFFRTCFMIVFTSPSAAGGVALSGSLWQSWCYLPTGQRDRGTAHQGVVRDDQHAQRWGAGNPRLALEPTVWTTEETAHQRSRTTNPAAEIFPWQVSWALLPDNEGLVWVCSV